VRYRLYDLISDAIAAVFGSVAEGYDDFGLGSHTVNSRRRKRSLHR